MEKQNSGPFEQSNDVEMKDETELEESLIVDHLHNPCWVDDTAELTEQLFQDMDFMLNEMEKKRPLKEGLFERAYPPIVVHCSAGIGRTGTLCALFNILEGLKFSVMNIEKVSQAHESNTFLHGRLPEVKDHPVRLSVYGSVRKLREQRMLMVKKQCQYKFIYGYLERWMGIQGQEVLQPLVSK